MNAFVLAGGESSRMGRDKALLDLAGRPLIAHALDKLRALGCTPRICASRPDLAGFAPVIHDTSPRCGPLGGLEAALSISGTDLNLFLPVDLPLLPLEFLRWLQTRAESTGAAATIPRYAGRPQPLCAIYSRRLLPGIRAALAAGHYKFMTAISAAAAALPARSPSSELDLFDTESIAAALIPHIWPADPPLHTWFRNINFPSDYDSLRAGFGNSPSGQNPAIQ
ncbi:MAG TPA: molybdenum cofactor guanylyltransferase [Acidobacteriaceae bacterium]